MITVVAALIQQNGLLLICQRRRTDAFPLRWEFPGGKVKHGESAAAALVRELAEELGVTAVIGHELYRTRHRYAEYADELELIFFTAAIPAPHDTGSIRNLAFERIEWVEPTALEQYDFLLADRELISLLTSGALRVP
ncbi:MAG: NUDIX hydrolase [Acidobacteria bacterium]|nr:MAG: NUDIX hydrolase [Acidobacteriota bacterium]